MNVTIRQIQAFMAVAATKSFSRAAEQLNVAQSRISVLIRELELELNVRLVDRTTRHMELTAAGDEFRLHGDKLMADLKHAVEDTRGLSERKRGRLTVAAPPLLMEALIPRLLLPFQRDFPGVRVTLIDARTDRIVEAVKAGHADVGIGTFAPLEEGLIRTRLARDALMLFCRQDHPMASVDRLRWKDIAESPLIILTPDSGVRQLVDYGCSIAGISVQAAYEVALATTALALIEGGLGISVLPANTLLAVRARPIVTRSLSNPTVWREICMISRHGRSLSPAAAEWLQRLQRTMKKMNLEYLRR